jgi:hypothetical protein
MQSKVMSASPVALVPKMCIVVVPVAELTCAARDLCQRNNGSVGDGDGGGR